MKIKTSELIGAQLDWAVCMAENDLLAAKCLEYLAYSRYMPKVSPSTDWAQGGPIIAREMITVGPAQHEGWEAAAWPVSPNEAVWGNTPLIAAMRCFCCAYFGDEVDIPGDWV